MVKYRRVCLIGIKNATINIISCAGGGIVVSKQKMSGKENL